MNKASPYCLQQQLNASEKHGIDLAWRAKDGYKTARFPFCFFPSIRPTMQLLNTWILLLITVLVSLDYAIHSVDVANTTAKKELKLKST